MNGPYAPLSAAVVRRRTTRLTARHDVGAAPLLDPDQSVSTVNCVLIATPNFWRMIAVPENDVNGLAKLGEDILTFDISDDALERAAAVADGKAITVGYCTHWYNCNWPMQYSGAPDQPQNCL
jgi:hypothetical protein